MGRPGRTPGIPVPWHAGLPAGCPDDDATASAGVRLITIDRPGYGRSDPHPNHSLLTWADDYAELHDLLGLPPCPIVGWSGGGPYALACAVRAPALVSSVGLAASSAPAEVMDEEGWADERRLADLLRLDRAAGVDALTQRYQGYADDPASIFSSWDDPDDPDVGLLALPDVNEAMVEMVREGLRLSDEPRDGELVPATLARSRLAAHNGRPGRPGPAGRRGGIAGPGPQRVNRCPTRASRQRHPASVRVRQ